MSRTQITTLDAPAAIGPYAQAVLADGWLWCSGQIALDPKTGEIVGQGTDADAARVQTDQCLKNLAAVLLAAGATAADAVRCTVYLADLSHFGAVNEIYGAFFGTTAPPSRACVEVSRLPRDVLVEIDCVARIASGD